MKTTYLNTFLHLLQIRSIAICFPFLLVLATVFVTNKELANGIISGKYFWFYGSMGLVSLTTLFTVICNKKRFRFSFLDLLLLLFCSSIALSALVFNNASQNTTKLTLLVLLLVLYFSFRIVCHCGLNPQSPDSKKFQIIFCIFIIITGLVEAIWGLRQIYGFTYSQHNLFKITGSFFNPGPYAGYLAMVFPMALSFFWQWNADNTDNTDQRETLINNIRVNPLHPCYLRSIAFCIKWLAGITCITILLVLPAAMSRASWLAVVTGSIVVIYSKYSTKILSLTKMKTPFRGLGGCAVILFLLVAFTGMYFLKKNSADGRALTWKISVQAAVKHPLGIGLGNFPNAYGEEQAAYFASGKVSEQEELVAGNPEYGFNEYLQILTESGIVSFILFIGIIVFALRTMIKKRDWGVLGSLIAILVFAFFSYPFSVLPYLIILVFLLSTSGSQWNEDDIAESKKQTESRKISITRCIKWLARLIHANPVHPSSIALIGCLLVGFSLYSRYPTYKAYKAWNVQKIYYNANMYKEVAKDCETLYPLLNDQTQFLFEYALSLSKTEQYEKSNAVLKRATQISCDPMLYNIMGKNYQAMKKYDQSEAAFLKSTHLVPNRLYPWYLLTKLYDEMGLPDKVRETAEIVLTKEPKVQSPAVREMREEVNKLRTKN